VDALYDIDEQTELEYTPQPLKPVVENPPTYNPTKKLTIAEYKNRQARKKEAELTRIPAVEIPKTKKKRGGRQVRLRRQRAVLLAIVEADPPPSWERATKIWQQIHEITSKLKWDTGFQKKSNLTQSSTALT